METKKIETSKIQLNPLVSRIEIENLDETLEKLEKIKSLIYEINDLSNGKLFQIIE